MQTNLNVELIRAIWEVVPREVSALILRFCFPNNALDTAGCILSPDYRSAINACREMPQKVVCIGDLHGNADELVSLWSRLKENMGEKGLAEAAVIFLGDYCDRGPNTKGVYDFLIHVDDTRKLDPNSGGTYFISGNHDFAFASFIGCLPIEGESPIDLDATKPAYYTDGFWPFKVDGGMHYQGRRWGGSAIYHASHTFDSYGVDMCYGEKEEIREQLIEAVPKSHKEFLKELKWIHVQPVPFPPGYVVAVHAGLEKSRDLTDQLEALHNRDLAADILFKKKCKERVIPFVGRTSVEPMHEELQGRAILVSGHHGFFHMEGDRIICDKSGGHAGPRRPLEAIILPERKIIGHCEPPKPPANLAFLKQIMKPKKKKKKKSTT